MSNNTVNIAELKNKNVVLLGGTGVVLSGATDALLRQGANVFVQSRSQSKLDQLNDKLQPTLQQAENVGKFHGFVGDFQTAEQAAASLAAANKAIEDAAVPSKHIDHVVQALAFVEQIEKRSSETSGDELRSVFDSGYFPNVNAISAFLPAVRDRETATYTIVSGGLAHGVFFPQAWTATVKNAALNNLALVYGADTAKDAVKFNVFCLHYAVAPIGGTKNQFGWDGPDTRELGPIFASLTQTKRSGQVVCGESHEQALKLTQQLLTEDAPTTQAS